MALGQRQVGLELEGTIVGIERLDVALLGIDRGREADAPLVEQDDVAGGSKGVEQVGARPLARVDP